MIRAIVPTHILRKWDAIAAAQLCEAARLQAEEIDRLRSDIRAADAWADGWRDDAERLQQQLAAVTHGQPGITQSGQLVVVRQ